MPAGFGPGGMGAGASLRTPDGRGVAFQPSRLFERNWTIRGFSYDANGIRLAFATVNLFETATNQWVATTTSGSDSVYFFTVDKTKTYFEVFYKAGSPDVYGTTVNTLMGVPAS